MSKVVREAGFPQNQRMDGRSSLPIPSLEIAAFVAFSAWRV